MSKTSIAVNLKLRLPPPLHKALVKEAKANHRSLNSEMIHKLVSTIPNGSDLVPPDYETLLKLWNEGKIGRQAHKEKNKA